MSIADDEAERVPSNGNSAKPRASDAGTDERTLLDSDQTAADADQTTSDLDQTGSDADQAFADREQHQANVDQDASDRDQAVADREYTAEPDRSQAQEDAHEASRDQRKTSTIARTTTAFARTEIAAERLEHATQRDDDALARDLTAAARDLAAEALDRAAVAKERGEDGDVAPRDPRIHRTAKQYDNLVGESGSQARARAAGDRARAAEDRELAARDREQSASDREQAKIALEQAHLDDLTGAYQRGIGLVALQHEIERARREDRRLVLGFVDVDELKLVNDRAGHAAGDAVLRAVGHAMRSKMRSYEPIVRFGGDEFVCALTDVDIDAAGERFDEMRFVLDSGQSGATISVGLAALEPGDSLDDLIERADGVLVAARRDKP